MTSDDELRTTRPPRSTAAHADYLSRPAWGNHEANLDFLRSTGLLRDRFLRILEIGSGQGLLLNALSKLGHHVVGIDIDPKRCEFDLPLCAALGDELPFPNDRFDMVLSFDVFEHIPDSDKHLREVRRVLTNDGHYLMQTPNKMTNIPFEMIRWSKMHGLRRMFDFLKPPQHCSLHGYWKLNSRLSQNGFQPTFHDVPIVNEYFRTKIEYFAGSAGLALLRVINPDKLPIPLRTNFYVDARLTAR